MDYDELKQKDELYKALDRLAEQIRQDTAAVQADIDRLTEEQEIRSLEHQWWMSNRP